MPPARKVWLLLFLFGAFVLALIPVIRYLGSDAHDESPPVVVVTADVQDRANEPVGLKRVATMSHPVRLHPRTFALAGHFALDRRCGVGGTESFYVAAPVAARDHSRVGGSSPRRGCGGVDLG